MLAYFAAISYPLSQADTQEWVKVIAFEGGHSMVRRLRLMGIEENTQFQVLYQDLQTGISIRCGNIRRIITHSMAKQLIVTPISYPLNE